MAVIFNAFGIREDATFGTFGAFIERDGQTFWSVMLGNDGWSDALPLPDKYMTKADARSTAEAYNVRVTGSDASKARIRGNRRIAWKATANGRVDGEWTFSQLIELGKLTAKQGQAIRSFYNVDAA